MPRPTAPENPADPDRERRPLLRDRQFADAQALTGAGSWSRDLSTDRSLWSEETCRIFGQPPGFSPTFEEVIALVHPEDRDRVRADLSGPRAGQRVETTYRIVRPDGMVRHVLGCSYGRAEHGEAIDYVYGSIQDVTERHAAETARHEAQELFETAFSQAPIGMGLVGLDGRWMKVNAALCEITGYSEEEMLSRTYREMSHFDPTSGDAERITELLAGEIASYQLEKRYVRPSGELVWVLVSVSLVRDAAGEPRHYVAQIADVNQRKLAESRLQQAEAEARTERDHATAIIAAMGEGYALTLGGEIKAVNEAMCELTGFSADELVGTQAPFPFWPPEHLEANEAVLAEIIANGGGRGEVTFMRADGDRFEAEITTRPAQIHEGRALGYVNTVRDVSSQKRYQRELERLARTDTLTGLSNRLVLQEALGREAQRRPDGDGRLALVLLDVDEFKQVNDALGHPAGDAVLIEVARRLERTVRAGEVLARVGGEEFAWLLPASSADEAIAAADRARSVIASEPFGAAGRLTVSAGVALLPTPTEGDRLYRLADRALYAAKQSGRDRTCCESQTAGGAGALLAGAV
ncbi:MAG: PAS domain S-box protein [Solirubrobacteraceae bacterium]